MCLVCVVCLVCALGGICFIVELPKEGSVIVRLPRLVYSSSQKHLEGAGNVDPAPAG